METNNQVKQLRQQREEIIASNQSLRESRRQRIQLRETYYEDIKRLGEEIAAIDIETDKQNAKYLEAGNELRKLTGKSPVQIL